MRSAADARQTYPRQREFDAYLWDIHKYGLQILEITQGKSLADFEQDETLRSGVERWVDMIGKAVLQMRLYHPEAAKQLERGEPFVKLQVALPENHDPDHAQAVWDAIERELPVLVAEVSVLLDEWHQG